MTAQGKVNAANVKRGDVILVTRDADKSVRSAPGTDGLYLSRVKREVTSATVLSVRTVQISSNSFRRSTATRYEITTDQGVLRDLAPIQTMICTGNRPEWEIRELEAPVVAEESPVVEEFPSAFEGAPPVRTHEDGSQTYGPYVTPEEKDQHSSDYWETVTEGLPREPAFTEPAAPCMPAQRGSAVVEILERVWGKIREDTPELPAVVIVTGSGMIGPPRWGHFRANGWTERAEKDVATNLVIGEMFVAGETLARGAEHTLETMLHEAAHVLAKVRDVKDTSRQGRWHNQRFRALAEELGLEYGRESAHSQIGFSEVTLTPGTKEQYAAAIEELNQAIRLTVTIPMLSQSTEGEQGAGEYMGHHGARKPRAEGGSATNNVKATCGCWPEPRIIRASRKVLEGARITCEECKEAFMDRSE